LAGYGFNQLILNPGNQPASSSEYGATAAVGMKPCGPKELLAQSMKPCSFKLWDELRTQDNAVEVWRNFPSANSAGHTAGETGNKMSTTAP